LTNLETAEHIRRKVEDSGGPFFCVADACGYDQHISFVKHRNEYWTGEGSFKQFCLDYADALEDSVQGKYETYNAYMETQRLEAMRQKEESDGREALSG